MDGASDVAEAHVSQSRADAAEALRVVAEITIHAQDQLGPTNALVDQHTTHAVALLMTEVLAEAVTHVTGLVGDTLRTLQESIAEATTVPQLRPLFRQVLQATVLSELFTKACRLANVAATLAPGSSFLTKTAWGRANMAAEAATSESPALRHLLATFRASANGGSDAKALLQLHQQLVAETDINLQAIAFLPTREVVPAGTAPQSDSRFAAEMEGGPSAASVGAAAPAASVGAAAPAASVGAAAPATSVGAAAPAASVGAAAPAAMDLELDRLSDQAITFRPLRADIGSTTIPTSPATTSNSRALTLISPAPPPASPMLGYAPETPPRTPVVQAKYRGPIVTKHLLPPHEAVSEPVSSCLPLPPLHELCSVPLQPLPTLTICPFRRLLAADLEEIGYRSG